MDVLCADKTGTLTRNALTVTTVRPMPGFDEAHVLALAGLASSDGGQDPVDAAIRAAAGGKDTTDAPQMVTFVPFDPARRCPRRPQRTGAGARPAGPNVS
jgi:H+-transporting ATPase